MPSHSKILTLQDLLARFKTERPKVIVTTNGCFDIVHSGHVSYLDWAKSQGDCLVLLLNTDASVRRLKGPSRPIVNEADRAAVLAALSAVDYVCFFDEDTPIEALKAIHPDVHVKANQYTEETLPEADVLKSMGTQMAFAPMLEGISTSDLIQRILKAYETAPTA